MICSELMERLGEGAVAMGNPRKQRKAASISASHSEGGCLQRPWQLQTRAPEGSCLQKGPRGPFRVPLGPAVGAAVKSSLSWVPPEPTACCPLAPLPCPGQAGQPEDRNGLLSLCLHFPC